MHTMHPTLLVGPADWDPARLPRTEFDVRLAALWQCEPSADGAIIYGDSRHHAELAWFTHFTPKLEAGLALIARAGDARPFSAHSRASGNPGELAPAPGSPLEPAPDRPHEGGDRGRGRAEARLLVGGGVNMLPAARPLTWIEALSPLRNAGATVAEWARALRAQRLVLVGGDAMPAPLRRAIVDALGAVAWEDASARVRRVMRVKRPRELALMREACATLDAAVTALAAAWQRGAAASVAAPAAILAAEQAALERGAQDVRTLFSANRGRTLRPFGWSFGAPDQTIDPLQAYIAVRHHGYWAEGFVMLAAKPWPALEQARKTLRSALALASLGTPRADLAQALAATGAAPHPVCDPAVVSMGLSLDDGEGDDDALSAGEVLSLRAGISDSSGAAIVSAMIAVHADGVELMWQQGASS